ncbi:putative F-box protein At1g49610 [Nicotiana tabacum]|uniref:F-box protein At1g49610 n=2 Tax=Nicotiana TaxID=4085 RepID=A0A1S3YBI3_TOBAC|nr:PREDICTED: putative F-box protein At1g49610 [Nicotiana sylvestris]XP_016449570.1 PREDICTED: putative F-box protein At1g49610 [Nicotiana tabacum]
MSESEGEHEENLDYDSPRYSPYSPRYSPASPRYSPSPSPYNSDQSYYGGKCHKTEKTDRISALPDSLILHILSSLDMGEVVRTGVLSKRWHLLWTSQQSLIFSYSGQHVNGIYKFVIFIDNTLLLCRSGMVKKFSVDFIYSKRFVRHVNRWMIFIKNKLVEELDLNLRSRGNLIEIYNLPQIMYFDVRLRHLSLCNCNLVPKEEIYWPALRDLEIGYAELNRDVIKKICSGCRALESLKFRSCYGVDYFDIDSKSVKKLVIHEYGRQNHDDADDDDDELGIYARNVTSLEICGYFHKRILVLEDVKALLDAKLDFYRNTDDYEIEREFRTDQNMLKNLLVSLQHVEKLSIGTWCLQVLTSLEIRNLPCPRMRCKYLTLNTPMKKWELPGIAILLQSCPQVEMLHINTESAFEEYHFGSHFKNSNDFNGENYWISRPCWVLHLKTLRIHGYEWWDGDEYILSFLQVVLKNGMVLQKIIIDFFEINSYEKLTKKLLSFPRSSREAVILFSS